MSEPMPDPAPPPQWEALQRREAARLLAAAAGCSYDRAVIAVMTLESGGVFLVRAVPSANST